MAGSKVMRWRLSDGYKMASVVVAVGLLLVVLNVEAIRRGGPDALGVISLLAAVFVAVLGVALMLQRESTD